MKVLTHIAGSHCVVQRNTEHYIDAKADSRYPGFTFVEVVHNGQVRKKECVNDSVAPERLIELTRLELL